MCIGLVIVENGHGQKRAGDGSRLKRRAKQRRAGNGLTLGAVAHSKALRRCTMTGSLLARSYQSDGCERQHGADPGATSQLGSRHVVARPLCSLQSMLGTLRLARPPRKVVSSVDKTVDIDPPSERLVLLGPDRGADERESRHIPRVALALALRSRLKGDLLLDPGAKLETCLRRKAERIDDCLRIVSGGVIGDGEVAIDQNKVLRRAGPDLDGDLTSRVKIVKISQQSREDRVIMAHSLALV